MSAVLIRPAAAVFCFLVIFFAGFWLARVGKPYPVLVFTLHKLISLGVGVWLGVAAYRASRLAPLSGQTAAVLIAAGLCFAALLVSGGIISAGSSSPAAVRRIHQLAPYLALIASTAGFVLLGR